MNILYLLAYPVALMGSVQLAFALLSEFLFRDGVEAAFLLPASLMLCVALLCHTQGRQRDFEQTQLREAMLFATSTWVSMGLLGAVPILLITGVSFTDSVFESLSGLTTTGATILTGLDALPRTFLLYRQFLQWLGGLGVVIFVVAVLPLLNVGGMKLLMAETPGPVKDDKLSPRIARTTHYLWFVYVALTGCCALAYLLAGMGPFDAVAHSFTTISTGGFSTHDASMGYFDLPVLYVCDAFMLLGAISFALHFRAWRGWRPRDYARDEETRVFLLLVLFLSGVVALMLFHKGLGDLPQALHESAFHLISFITSTGYGAADITAWPNEAVLLLVFASYLGGCAGSTAGGNKIIRNILTVKLANRELKRLVHPQGIFCIRFQGQPVADDVLRSSIAFMCLAATTSMVLTLALMVTGLSFWSSFTAVAACINVLGPAFAELGSNFRPVSDAGTWILSFAMVLGRLEYFTLLALLLPSFWRDF